MGARIPDAKRAEVVATYKRMKAANARAKLEDIAKSCGVGSASLKRWLAKERGEGGARRHARGHMLSRDHKEEVVAKALAEPSLRLYELAAWIGERAGFSVHPDTVRRALNKRGIRKRFLARQSRAEPAKSDGTRYTEKHRRKPEDKPHRRAYPSDYSDEEWALVGPLWKDQAQALPVENDLRDVLDAIRYVAAAGCPWRFLPHEFPPWETVYAWFDRWGRDGTLDRVNSDLRRLLRREVGREDTPSLLIIDSQTVKTREGGAGRGYDGGKKIAGRKRHIAVDTLGLVWFAKVHPANVQDRDGIDLTVPDNVREELPRLSVIIGDAGYQGKAEVRTQTRTGVRLEIARRRGDGTRGEWSHVDGPPPTADAGFQVVPQRWIVERSLSWGTRRRRLTCDFERKPANSSAWFAIAIHHTMTARLAD